MPFKVAARAARADRHRVVGRDPVDLDRIELVQPLALQQRQGGDVVRRDSRDRRESAPRRSALGRAASASLSTSSACVVDRLEPPEVAKRGERRRGIVDRGGERRARAPRRPPRDRGRGSGRWWRGARGAHPPAPRAAPPSARSISVSRRATKRSRRVRKVRSKSTRNRTTSSRAPFAVIALASVRPRRADMRPDRLADRGRAGRCRRRRRAGRWRSAISSTTVANLSWP